MGARAKTSADRDQPPSAPRVRIIAPAVVGAVAALLILGALLLGGGSDPAEAATLRVERAVGASGLELIVYVEDPADNQPEVSGGRSSVRLDYLDADGRTLVGRRHPWPFTDTDDGITDPHVHQPAPRDRVQQVTQCRLAGTEGPLEGQVTEATLR